MPSGWLQRGADPNVHADAVRVAARLHKLRGRNVPGDKLRRRGRVPTCVQRLQCRVLQRVDRAGPEHDLQRRGPGKRGVRGLDGAGDERGVPDFVQRRVHAAGAERRGRVQPVQ